MNKASDAKKVMELIYSSISKLTDCGVQVMYLSNGASITVELSSFREVLKTVSVILFPKDFDTKMAFLTSLIDNVLTGDSFLAIEKGIRDYNEKFPF